MPGLCVLVCDDSSMARKQLIRALPASWVGGVVQAAQGMQALSVLRERHVDLVLLDLTMPVMDGYQVLAAMQAEGLGTKVIVVSADVQEQARSRVMALGALAFIRKPAEPRELHRVLHVLGFVSDAEGLAPNSAWPHEPQISFRDAFREVVNISIGRAGALLARVLGVFVQLPVPNVNVFEVGELHMALQDTQRDGRLTAVCQGYIGGGIAGEALLIFHDAEVADMARLMQRQEPDYAPMEMLLDLSSILIGACLSGIAEQLNVRFSQGHPQILGEHAPIEELVRLNGQRWRRTLAVEVSYSIEGHDIHFDLLLLFTEDSLALLTEKVAYLSGQE